MAPEIIELLDTDSGCSYRDEVFVRGHHDPIVAMHAVIEYLLGYEGGDWPDWNPYWEPAHMSYCIPVPKYARWSCEYTASDDPTLQVLRTYDEPGRGRFKVMVAYPTT